MTFLDEELAEQPVAAARLLESAWPRLAGLAGVVRAPDTSGVLVVARGTSDNAARYAQYLWGLRHGLPVTLATPSLVSVYGRSLELRGHSVVAVSQSGSSPDVVGFVERARDDGRPTLALTNDAGSALARAAEHVLPLGAGPERSVAATKTYTASLLAVALVSVALSGQATGGDGPDRDRAGRDWADRDWADRDWADAQDVQRVPAALDAAVHGIGGVDEAAALLAPYHRAICVGRGVNLATAHEVALKLTELTGTLVAPYSPADLLHGPVAAVGPDVPVLLVVPEEPATASVLDVVPELQRRGAPVVLLAPTDLRHSAPGPDVCTVTLPRAAGLPGWLTPVTAVVTGQLLARRLAELRGVDVDRPGELSKVTRTA